WIPPKELRDLRDLPRTRMVLVQQRTRLKNRIHATLDKYGLKVEGVSDIYGRRGRPILEDRIQSLPPHTRFTTEQLLELMDSLNHPIQQIEKRMIDVLQPTRQTLLLQTLPGVGPILSFVIGPEVGDVDRFPGPDRYASYSGTTPRVYSSGGKTRHGRLRPDVNRYLKWAYVEAANCVARQRENWQHRHGVILYLRIRQRRGHPKAVGAVARHLAEATYWMLKKEEPYRDPKSPRVSSTER
nr:IS110 family transposase [Akkermansiaceae bacterium]